MISPRPLLFALAAAALTAPASAVADPCPGADSCPYVAVTQVGQPAGGTLRFPQAVAVGANQEVYVGDQGSHVIQVFDANGTFLRAIGGPGGKAGQLTAVGALASAGDGSIFAADGGGRVDRFDPSGSLLGSFGSRGRGVGQFAFGGGRGNDAGAGGGLAVTGNTVFVADSGNDRIQRFSLDGSAATVLVPPGLLAYPKGLAVRKTRLFIADDQNHRVVVTDTGGRQLTTIGTGEGPAPGQLSFPYGVAADAAGRVFVSDNINHRVSRFSTAPAYGYKARFGSFGTAPGRLAYPRALAVDATGNVYVANTGNDRVDVFDRGGTLLRSMGTSGRAPGQFNTPLGVGSDSSGITAVTDGVNGRIQLLRPDGSVAAVWGSPNPGPTVLPRPIAVAFDTGGNAYVLDQRRARIVVFSRATGRPVRSIGSQGKGPGKLLDPEALAISQGGTIVVADRGNGRIARFRTDGSALPPIADTGPLRGVAITPDGSSVYGSRTNNKISVWNADGIEQREFSGSGRKVGLSAGPAQMALDAAGNLWVADRANNRVQQFGPAGERLGAFGRRGTGPGEFIQPTGVSVSCDGSLTVSDTDGNRVQRFVLAGAPAAGCGSLPPVAVPPTPKSPTLPAPDGPLLTLKVLRSRALLGRSGVPVRVGCDTPCTVSTTATLTATRPATKASKRAKGKRTPPKPVVETLKAAAVPVPAGTSRIVRLRVSAEQAARLRRALGRRTALSLTVQAVATSPAGSSTTVSESTDGTR